MTLLTIAIPSYNASAYLHYCVNSLVIGGDDVEILIINDGSSDDTTLVGARLEKQYSNVRLVNQENKGHGGAVNTGIAEARGQYFKVVDSDDWVDPRAYLKILETLKSLNDQGTPVDAFIANFVYEKEGLSRKKSMRYDGILPENRVFTWDEVGDFGKGQYMMMHSLIYQTELLRAIHFTLPEHTFYVDNLFVFTPLQDVKTLYYLPVDFYRYLIGRDDQSINEKIMIERIDQQLKVNKLIVDQFDETKITNPKLRIYLVNHVEITTVISSALLNRAGTSESLAKKQELWAYIKDKNPKLYREIRNGLLGQLVKPSVYPSRKLANAAYRITRRIYGFN